MNAQFPIGNTQDSPIVFPYSAPDLISSIDIIPNQWGKLGGLGIFGEDSVDTTVVELKYRQGFISILPSSPRGTVPLVDTNDDEAAIFIAIPHFPGMDLITPADLQNRMAFVPGDNQTRRLMTVEDMLAKKLMNIKLKHDLTLEYLRMGALKGQVYDGTGKLIVDLFNTFGITQQVFTFTFSSPTFNVKQYTYQVARYIELNLHGDVMDNIEVEVSPEFFDALTSHPSVEKFYLNWKSQFNGDDRKGFQFGALTFSEYNAQVPNAPLPGILQQQTQGQSGMLRFIESGAGYAYPSGTRDTFRTYFGPANTISTVNKPGTQIFVSPKILDHQKGIELFHESNPLPICRRPNVLAKVVAA